MPRRERPRPTHQGIRGSGRAPADAPRRSDRRRQPDLARGYARISTASTPRALSASSFSPSNSFRDWWIARSQRKWPTRVRDYLRKHPHPAAKQGGGDHWGNEQRASENRFIGTMREPAPGSTPDGSEVTRGTVHRLQTLAARPKANGSGQPPRSNRPSARRR